MSTERISLPDDDELGAVDRAFLATVPAVNVWRMLARTGIAPEFAVPLRSVFDGDWFPVEDREIMLFRTCRANGSTYEIPQHREYGTLATEVVDAILSDDVGPLTDWQQALCRMCDEMTKDAKLTPDSVGELVAHYGSEDMACRAIFTMAWFNMLTRYVDSTGVPLEEGPNPYAGIDSRGPVAAVTGEPH